MRTLENKEYIKCGFEIVVSLVDCECGWSLWSDKWKRDSNGPIVSDGEQFDCDWYSIGQLNKGNDMTVARAQKEFEADRYRFDTSLKIEIYKNGIELLSDHVIGSDFSFDDDYTLEQSFNNLINDHLDDESYIKEAKQVLTDLLSDVE